MAMNIKKIMLLVLLLLLFNIGGRAMAAVDVTAVKNLEKDKVTITVDSGEKVKSLPVTVKIVQLNDNSNEDVINYITSGYTDEDGIFSFTYKNDMHTGNFKVYANVNGTLGEGSYFKMGEKEYAEIAAVIESQLASQNPSGTEVKNVFDKYNDGLVLDTTQLNKLQDKDAVYQIIAEDSTYKGKVLGQIETVFYSAVFQQSVNENKDTLPILASTEPYKTVLNIINPLVVSELNRTDATVTATVLQQIGICKNIEELGEKLEFLLFQTNIQKAKLWKNVQDTLTQYKDILGIDMEKASTQVYKDMIGKSYSSYDDCKKDFNALKEKYSSKSVSGRGTGGGGRSTGGGTVADPVVNNQQTGEKQGEIPQIQKGELIFSDMEDAKWAYEAVRYIAEKGIVSGTGDNKFEPNREVSRYEAVKMLALALDIQGEEQLEQLPFKDVSPEHWSYPYLCALYYNTIINGKTKEEFCGNDKMTRQELAVMAYKSLKQTRGVTKKSKNDISAATADVSFDDAESIAPWAYDAMSYLVEKKILVGKESSNGVVIAPLDSVTRAEAAMVIYNLIK